MDVFALADIQALSINRDETHNGSFRRKKELVRKVEMKWKLQWIDFFNFTFEEIAIFSLKSAENYDQREEKSGKDLVRKCLFLGESGNDINEI
jgi:predicted glutamine amidotransferase